MDILTMWLRRRARNLLQQQWGPFFVGLVTALFFSLLWAGDPEGFVTLLRERAIDAVQLAMPRTNDRARVVVVDIDDRTIDAFGGWPLPREALARLTSTILDAKPDALVFDIFFPGPDRRSARTLVNEAATLSRNATVKNIVGELPDTDKDFSQALARGPTVIGMLAADETVGDMPTVIASKTHITADMAGPIGGFIAPYPPLASGALGVGVQSLFGEDGGLVRKTPLLMGAGGAIAPGLALEAVRIARKIAMLNVDADKSLALEPRAIALREGGALRVRWSDPALWPARTLSAADIFAGAVAPSRFENAVVLIGTSAPEAAALRPTPAGPLTPTVQIQAEAVQQLLDGVAPRRPDNAALLEGGVVFVFGALAAVAATFIGPAAAIAILSLVTMGWVALVAFSLAKAQIVLDPIGPPLAIFFAGNAAGAAAFARTRRLKALISRRFEQYLAADVVHEIIAHPDRLRRAGEMRDVTALFTDVENFTPMTLRLAPQELIALLDDYLGNLCRIVTEHGGMVDGIVGDAIHAFFNVPLERAGHVDSAIDCAMEIVRFSEEFRRSPRASTAAFGRTRIGVETGRAIVGDVGGQQRLNYTAYGDAVIVAARLEPANKLFDTSICIGPGAAAAAKRHELKPLGAIELKGIKAQTQVYTVGEGTPKKETVARSQSPS